MEKDFEQYIQAAFSGLWIETAEAEYLQRSLIPVCERHQWFSVFWNVAQGVSFGPLLSRFLNESKVSLGMPNGAQSLQDIKPPGMMLGWIPKLKEQIDSEPSVYEYATSKQTTIVVFTQNLHLFIEQPLVLQTALNTLAIGTVDRIHIVNLSPTANLPKELEKKFVVLEHSLPKKTEFSDIMKNVTNNSEEIPSGEDLEQTLFASSGLTRDEASNAYALSIVRKSKICQDVVWQVKYQAIKKSGVLRPLISTDMFSSIGGLDMVKQFMLKSIKSRSKARPKGVLLLGVPGTGKSALAKALGNETKRQTLAMDIGASKSKYVGESEGNIRRALALLDVMEPSIVFIDEIEKAFAGATSGNDSGVSSGIFGTFLTWSNDHTSEVYVICTANNIDSIPIEFLRAERFDAIFFLDFPSPKEREAIWKIYRDLYQIDAGDSEPNDNNWTGAEIKACCRIASLTGVTLREASSYVVPVYIKDREKIDTMRERADGRYLSASVSGYYQNPNKGDFNVTSTKRTRGIAN